MISILTPILPDLIRHTDQLPVMTSRGCPYRCGYCASRLLYDGFRRRDPVRVADEIEFWHTHIGIKHFSFYDDALFVDPRDMAIRLLKEIIRRILQIQFHCPNGLHLREISSEPACSYLRRALKLCVLAWNHQTSPGR